METLSVYIKVENELFNLLNQLHERGFYQRLHLIENIVENLQQLFSGNDFDLLHRLREDFIFGLSSLSYLEVLTFTSFKFNMHFEFLSKHLVNIERISVNVLCNNMILPFIRNSVKLTEIKMKYNDLNNVFESAWNKEREKLTGARKVIIYVPEWQYLEMKWAMTTIDYPLVALRRTESSRWTRDFHV